MLKKKFYLKKSLEWSTITSCLIIKYQNSGKMLTRLHLRQVTFTFLSVFGFANLNIVYTSTV